jgi:anti-anti-sigma regulatory factor
VVDFAEVHFVHSAGLGVMLTCIAPLRGQCRLGFAGLDDNVGRVLERVGFLEMQGLCFYGNLSEALQAFSPEPT